MPMRAKHVPGLLAAAGLCLLTCRSVLPQAPAAQSGAAPPAIRIDGRTDDWSSSKLFIDAKSGSAYAVENDGRHLFILFVAKAGRSAESLESTGLTVVTRAVIRKKNSARGVLFLRRPVPAETYILWSESQGAPLTEAEKRSIREAGERELGLAFAVGPGGSIHGPLRRLDAENEPPLFAAAGGPPGITYELKIPLAAPGLVPGGLDLSPGETVRISFEWGGAARRMLSPKATRQTPPAEQGGLYGVSSPAQEFLSMFDALSRPTVGTRKFSFSIDVRLADAR
jgi:hypothetical protein